MSTANETLMAKLRKLHAMAEGAADVGNMAEAEAFASKVAALLAEHQLDPAVLATGDVTETVCVDLWWQYSDARQCVIWRNILTWAVMQANFVTGYSRHNGLSEMRMFGTRANIERAQYLATVLCRMCDTAGRNYPGNRAAKNAYRLGWAAAVATRLQEGRKTADATSTSNALVLQRADAAAMQYRKEVQRREGVKTSQIRGGTVRDTAAYGAGHADGQSAQWSAGIGSAPASRSRMLGPGA